MPKKPGRVENLKPVKSKDEARERGKKGGIKSGKVRREQKSMRQLMRLLLALPADTKQKEKMDKLGVPEEEQNNKMSVAVGLLRQAQLGDPNAVKTLCGIAGDIFEGDEEESESIAEQLKDFKVEFVDASQKRGKK